MSADKTIELFEEHYQMLLLTRDARTLPMKLLRAMIDSVKLQIEKADQ